MKHLGDITAIDWSTVEPVDVVTGGSPCQGLSVAGLRKGLADERSGLFMEQIKCVKELGKADEQRGRTGQFIRPRYMVWENVNGAFSSGKPKGADFAAVIEEIIKVAEPRATVSVCVPNGGWTKSGCYYAEDGSWSIAWRVHDAQFWGVPQRRKRISLVADFGGLSAPEVLFERKGLSGHPAESGAQRENTSPDTEGSIGADDYEGVGGYGNPCGRPCSGGTQAADRGGVNCGLSTGRNGVIQTEVLPFDTTQVTSPQNGNNPKWGDPCHPLATQGHPPTVICKTYDARGNGDRDIVSTITGDHNNRVIDYTSLVCEETPTFCIEGNGQRESHKGDDYIESDTMYTLNTVERHAVCYAETYQKTTGPLMANSHPGSYCGQDAYQDMLVVGKVQEETPIALDRAFYNQGQNAQYSPQFYEDGTCPTLVAKGPGAVCTRYIVRRLTPLECERLQGYPDGWTDIGDWTDSKGRKRKAADAPRYKALGNSIALPFWKWLLKRISAQYERDATLGSLFDGIGGFPLCWEQINGKGTARWASEIEEFPIAVTKIRFPEVE